MSDEDIESNSLVEMLNDAIEATHVFTMETDLPASSPTSSGDYDVIGPTEKVAPAGR